MLDTGQGQLIADRNTSLSRPDDNHVQIHQTQPTSQHGRPSAAKDTPDNLELSDLDVHWTITGQLAAAARR